MWVIRIFSDLAEKRANTLSNVFDNTEDTLGIKSYMSDISSRFKKVNITYNLPNAKIYKSKHSADRLIREFEKESNSTRDIYWDNKFYFIKGRILQLYKLSSREFNSIIDNKIIEESNKHQLKVSKLDNLRSGYKS